MPREISCKTIEDKLKELIASSVVYLPEDIKHGLEKARKAEKRELSKQLLNILIENYKLAEKNNLPLCQDTGALCVYIKIGQDVQITNGDLNQTINKAVSEVYKGNYLRKSICSSLERVNTQDNTPAFVDYEITSGDKLQILVVPKGGGCENMTKMSILKPGIGIDGIKEYVLKCVRESSSAPCPPYVLGVGIGGNAEICVKLSKKALYRNIDIENPDKKLNSLEKELMEEINKLEIGVAGSGGSTTCMRVNIETYPTHITSLPVCVSFGCNSLRKKEIVI